MPTKELLRLVHKRELRYEMVDGIRQFRWTQSRSTDPRPPSTGFSLSSTTQAEAVETLTPVTSGSRRSENPPF